MVDNTYYSFFHSRSGWFPATYVKVLQSGRLSGRSTPVSGGKVQMNETILGKYIKYVYVIYQKKYF